VSGASGRCETRLYFSCSVSSRHRTLQFEQSRVHSTTMAKSRTGYILAGLLIIFGTLALVTATGLPKFLTIKAGPVEIDLGAFENCYSVQDSDQHCGSIDKSCSMTVAGQSVKVNNNCDQFNAFRAFLVLADILAIITSLLVILHIFKCVKPDRRKMLILGLLAGIFGMISMALFVDLNDNQSDSYGPSFGLEVSGWVLVFVGSFLYTHFRGGLSKSSDYFAF
jgi:hypothetical protein